MAGSLQNKECSFLKKRVLRSVGRSGLSVNRYDHYKTNQNPTFILTRNESMDGGRMARKSHLKGVPAFSSKQKKELCLELLNPCHRASGLL